MVSVQMIQTIEMFLYAKKRPGPTPHLETPLLVGEGVHCTV